MLPRGCLGSNRPPRRPGELAQGRIQAIRQGRRVEFGVESLAGTLEPRSQGAKASEQKLAASVTETLDQAQVVLQPFKPVAEGNCPAPARTHARQDIQERRTASPTLSGQCLVVDVPGTKTSVKSDLPPLPASPMSSVAISTVFDRPKSSWTDPSKKTGSGTFSLQRSGLGHANSAETEGGQGMASTFIHVGLVKHYLPMRVAGPSLHDAISLPVDT